MELFPVPNSTFSSLWLPDSDSSISSSELRHLLMLANFSIEFNKSLSSADIFSQIPENFRRMSSSSRNCIIAYMVLFLIGVAGNLTIFITLGRKIFRRNAIRSRTTVLIFNLATADLFVCFAVIPIEVFWRLTIQWHGGDVLCKLSQFFRAFGLYLSSMVIICISLDRFFAIVFPLKVIGGMKRVRRMLWVAWASAFLFAAPQVTFPAF